MAIPCPHGRTDIAILTVAPDMSLLGTLSGAVRSPRTAIGTAAAVDLGVRFGELRPLLGGAGDLLAPAVSLGVGALTAAKLGTATTWLLFAVSFWVVAPRLLPAVARETTERFGFRALFAASAVAFGYYLRQRVVQLGPLNLLGLVALALLACVLVVGYFHAVADWDLLGPDGEAVDLLDAFQRGDAAAERRTDRGYTGAVRVVADALWLCAVGTVVVLPAFAAGILVLFFVNAYPLPDLLAVGYVAAAPVARRLDRGVSGGGALEERVLLGAREAARTLKGATLSIAAGIGLFGAGGVTLLAVGTTPGAFELLRLALDTAPGVAWLAAGSVGCLYVSAAHLLWAWNRSFRRLPAFLARWRGASDTPDPLVARPPLSIVPGLMAFGAAAGCVVLLDVRPVPLVGLLWPLALVPAIVAVVIGRRRPPEPTDHEDHRIAVAATVEILALLVIAGPLDRTTVTVDANSIADALLVPLHGVTVVLLIGVVYLPDAIRYADDQHDYRRFAGGAYLTMVGVAVGVVGAVPGGPLAGTYAFVAGSFVVLAVPLLLVKWFRL